MNSASTLRCFGARTSSNDQYQKISAGLDGLELFQNPSLKSSRLGVAKLEPAKLGSVEKSSDSGNRPRKASAAAGPGHLATSGRNG